MRTQTANSLPITIARPHIHVAWLAHGSHSHDGEHCHHHNADGSHSHSPTPATETEQDDHDSDAVYLPNDIGVSLPTKSVTSLDNFEIISTLTIAVVPSTTSVTDCVTGPFFPGECSPACPLWLVTARIAPSDLWHSCRKLTRLFATETAF